MDAKVVLELSPEQAEAVKALINWRWYELRERTPFPPAGQLRGHHDEIVLLTGVRVQLEAR